MKIELGPNAVDEPNLLYKLQRKIKVFNTDNPLPNRGYNLVASSVKYGIVFVGSPDGTLSAYHLKELVDKECEPQHFAVKLLEKPTHVAVSCDDELLATTGGQLLCVYKVVDFQNVNVSPAVTIKLDTDPTTFVSSLQWNPCIPDSIAITCFDGTVCLISVTTSEVFKKQGRARCICWSPKGKQYITGNMDGSIFQHKPDKPLTLVKRVAPPDLFGQAPVEVLAVYWISTYQYAAVYKNTTDNSRPVVGIINTPKAGEITLFNYEDICYSMGPNRPWYYYLLGLAQWNVILASSSNSMEIATLGSTDGSNWMQWCQTDEARPELPLTDKKKENYPVGVCIDSSSVHQLPWGENDTLPFMPTLLVVSQTGLLTIFNVINLNNQAGQVCTPPQQLQLISLPAAALTTDIPDDAPAQVTMPAPAVKPQVQPIQTPQPVQQTSQPIQIPQPVQPFSQPVQTVQPTSQPVQISLSAQPFSQPIQTPQPVQATIPSSAQFGSILTGQPKPQVSQTILSVPQPKPSEPKQPEVKPIAMTPQVTQASVTQAKPSAPKPQAPEVNAALKAEQERVNRLKMDQELRSMLVKEVNDFQMELYNFVKKTRDVQFKVQQDLNQMDANFNFQSLSTEQLKKECDLEELRSAIIQLKLELVRACAVIAEARTHAEAKDFHQWSQVDPLTSKRVASVKNLAYYVQTQLEQAQKALDYKWNEMAARDPNMNKPGQYMIRPILDDVYQPLVKQQEILSRQQAVLRTLRNTMNECDATPMFKSTSLLRSTPFRNKDPLSKLTKNILNMSIEPQNKNKECVLSSQKLDALRDMLSNHKPTKIKPVDVELREHLTQMRISYEKSMKEKAKVQESQYMPVRPEPQIPQMNMASVPIKPAPQMVMRQESTPKQLQPQITIPTFTPVNTTKQTPIPGLPNVARTLFGEDKPALQTPIPFQPQPSKPQQPMFSLTGSLQTRSVKDVASNDANIFMGQRICSPSAFTSTPLQSHAQPAPMFTSKPISDINNMFNKFTPSFGEPKPQPVVPKSQSNETDESKEPTKPTKPVEMKKEKPAAAFAVKPPLTATSANTQNIPDLVKTNNQATSKSEVNVPKAEKPAGKSKENISEQSSENVAPTVQKQVEPETKENAPQSFSFGSTKSASSIFGVPSSTPIASPATTPSEPSKPTHVKEDKPKVESKPETPKVDKSEAPPTPTTPSASSLFAAANASSPTAEKPKLLFGTPTSSPTSATTSQPATLTVNTSTTKESSVSSASSLFASASASQAFAKPTQTGSIFSPTTTASNVFGSTQGSIFGTTVTTQSTSVFGNSAVSVVSSAETKPSSPTSAFGSAVTTAQSAFASSPSSVFASAVTTNQSTVFGSSSVFGTTSGTTPVFGATTKAASVFASTAATTTQSLFGTGTPTTAQSIFGTAAANAATTQSVFGTATSTTAQSVFGGTTTTTQSVFGSTASSIFGAAAATTQASVFGSPVTTAQSVFGTPTTQASIFGSAPTTQSSIFGAATTQASVFGATTQASVFGSPTLATQSSVFGSPTVTTQASVFGAPTQTTQASVGSLFGGSDNLFAAASISTTSAPSPASGGSIFGGGSGSVFGGGTASPTNVFGGKGQFSQTNTQAASIFGGGSSFAQKPAGNTDFWSGGSNTGSAFGTSTFGQQATTQASSIFGGATGGSFSSPSGGQPFGSPQQASVFGTPQQQASPGFGGSSVFGSKPAFGQSAGFGSPASPGGGFGAFGGFNKSPSSGFGAPAAFGASAAFGGAAAFGATPAFGGAAPGNMFGGAAPPANFATTQSNATFEQLATQNTLTFGNLAQQSSAPSPPAPTFNTSPSFTGWRG